MAAKLRRTTLAIVATLVTIAPACKRRTEAANVSATTQINQIFRDLNFNPDSGFFCNKPMFFVFIGNAEPVATPYFMRNEFPSIEAQEALKTELATESDTYFERIREAAEELRLATMTKGCNAQIRMLAVLDGPKVNDSEIWEFKRSSPPIRRQFRWANGRLTGDEPTQELNMPRDAGPIVSAYIDKEIRDHRFQAVYIVKSHGARSVQRLTDAPDLAIRPFFQAPQRAGGEVPIDPMATFLTLFDTHPGPEEVAEEAPGNAPIRRSASAYFLPIYRSDRICGDTELQATSAVAEWCRQRQEAALVAEQARQGPPGSGVPQGPPGSGIKQGMALPGTEFGWNFSADQQGGGGGSLKEGLAFANHRGNVSSLLRASGQLPDGPDYAYVFGETAVLGSLSAADGQQASRWTAHRDMLQSFGIHNLTFEAGTEGPTTIVLDTCYAPHLKFSSTGVSPIVAPNREQEVRGFDAIFFRNTAPLYSNSIDYSALSPATWMALPYVLSPPPPNVFFGENSRYRSFFPDPSIPRSVGVVNRIRVALMNGLRHPADKNERRYRRLDIGYLTCAQGGCDAASAEEFFGYVAAPSEPD